MAAPYGGGGGGGGRPPPPRASATPAPAPAAAWTRRELAMAVLAAVGAGDGIVDGGVADEHPSHFVLPPTAGATPTITPGCYCLRCRVLLRQRGEPIEPPMLGRRASAGADVGMYNHGENLCYLNAVFQAMVHQLHFVDGVRGAAAEHEGALGHGAGFSTACLTCQLGELMRSFIEEPTEHEAALASLLPPGAAPSAALTADDIANLRAAGYRVAVPPPASHTAHLVCAQGLREALNAHVPARYARGTMEDSQDAHCDMCAILHLESVFRPAAVGAAAAAAASTAATAIDAAAAAYGSVPAPGAVPVVPPVALRALDDALQDAMAVDLDGAFRCCRAHASFGFGFLTARVCRECGGVSHGQLSVDCALRLDFDEIYHVMQRVAGPGGAFHITADNVSAALTLLGAARSHDAATSIAPSHPANQVAHSHDCAAVKKAQLDAMVATGCCIDATAEWRSAAASAPSVPTWCGVRVPPVLPIAIDYARAAPGTVNVRALLALLGDHLHAANLFPFVTPGSAADAIHLAIRARDAARAPDDGASYVVEPRTRLSRGAVNAEERDRAYHGLPRAHMGMPFVTYRLRSLVCHVGAHYVSFQFSATRQAWKMYNDDREVVELQWAAVIDVCETGRLYTRDAAGRPSLIVDFGQALLPRMYYYELSDRTAKCRQAVEGLTRRVADGDALAPAALDALRVVRTLLRNRLAEYKHADDDTEPVLKRLLRIGNPALSAKLAVWPEFREDFAKAIGYCDDPTASADGTATLSIPERYMDPWLVATAEMDVAAAIARLEGAGAAAGGGAMVVEAEAAPGAGRGV